MNGQEEGKIQVDILFGFLNHLYGHRFTPEMEKELRAGLATVEKTVKALRRVGFAWIGSAIHPCRSLPTERRIEPMAENPVFLSLRSLAVIQTRQVSPLELTRTFLHRLEQMGPAYHAVVTVTRDLALQQARQAEEEIASGRYRGPLHGIPYGAKNCRPRRAGFRPPGGRHAFGIDILTTMLRSSGD